MAEIRAQIAAYWEAQSATYDDAPDHRLHDAAERAAWLAFLQAQLPPPPARVLDLGTGTGFLALLLAELGHDVTGIDIAAGMIAAAREKAVGLASPPTFAVGDAGAPDVGAGSIDAIISRHLLWTLPDPTLALRNWHRALAPGGRLLAIDGLWANAAHDHEPEDTTPTDEDYERYYTEEVRANLPLLREQTLDRALALIAEAGFVELAQPSLAMLARASAHFHAASVLVAARRP